MQHQSGRFALLLQKPESIWQRLPLDILLHMVHLFARNEVQDQSSFGSSTHHLRQLSLVCRSWARICVQVLYRSLYVRSPVDLCQHLKDVKKKNGKGHLEDCVKKLHVVLKLPQDVTCFPILGKLLPNISSLHIDFSFKVRYNVVPEG